MPSINRISFKDKVQIVTRYAKNKGSLSSLARDFRCHKKSVTNCLSNNEILYAAANSMGITVPELKQGIINARIYNKHNKDTPFDDKVQMVTRYASNEGTMDSVADDFGCREWILGYSLKKEDIITAAAESMGITVSELKQKMMRVGGNFTNRKRLPFDDKVQMVTRYASNEGTVASIARDFGCSRTSCLKYLRNDDILSSAAESIGITVSELRQRIEDLDEKHSNKRLPFDDKVQMVTRYASNEGTMDSIADVFGYNGKSAMVYLRNEKVLNAAAIAMGIDLEELKQKIIIAKKLNYGIKPFTSEELLKASPDSAGTIDAYRIASRYSTDTESMQMAGTAGRLIYEKLNGQKSRTSPDALARLVYTMPKMNLGVIRLDESSNDPSNGFEDSEALEMSLAELNVESETAGRILSRYHMDVIERMRNPQQARNYLKDLERLGAGL
ncbi:MAG: hypothetical protein JXC85_03740 [Candidatus Aenigmarchaeota archaeon]|nr:hypothetical protein [Candidatus Aenigmarchaeota archaeon]